MIFKLFEEHLLYLLDAFYYSKIPHLFQADYTGLLIYL